ncbi:hypothetical protein Poli38472_007931 [Pythium oligandrum]|uniref:Protein kinase domain-containing protein n=1 Tax=Pythium oligandrum TaxID=41045 RepID=A0A8K1CKN5_PYTOL|nr:hypothetical protein Poli38472_007931 [Pythium oligandrum]|eukprot:TMW65289.1 hypothetical protein Poli38472_007931 [Pythium oligandrum]
MPPLRSGTRSCGATTATVDPTDAKRALVQYDNCTKEVVKLEDLPDARRVLDLKHRGIQRVESIPEATELLDISWNPRVTADLSTHEGLTSVYARGCELTDLSQIKLPSRLQELNLRTNNFTRLAAESLPVALQKLKISQNEMKSLDELASLSSLQVLLASENQIEAIHKLSPAIQVLDLSYNKLSALEDVRLPPKLTQWNVSFNSISAIHGVQFPSTLEKFDVRSNPIAEFRVNKGDFELFRNDSVVLATPSEWKPSASKCPDVEWIGTMPLCVVVDSGQSAAEYSAATVTPIADHNGTSGSANADANVTGGYSHDAGRLALFGGIMVGLCALVLTFLLFTYRRRQKRGQLTIAQFANSGMKKAPPLTTENRTSKSTFMSSTSPDPSELSNSMAPIALTPISTDATPGSIWVDSNLSSMVLPAKSWYKDRVFAFGDYGEIFVAKSRAATRGSKFFLVKQIHPLAALTTHGVEQFVEEVQLCSKLRHRHLVPFVGVTGGDASTSLGYACDYISDGDLQTALARQRSRVDHHKTFQWFSSTSSEIKTRKLDLARELVHALEYLHSLDTPVVYQSLTSKHVLLVRAQNIQLSLFGICQTVALHDMLTKSGTGGSNVPWIAPEILKGGKCDVTANVYSLGVILSELDTCQPPYRSGSGDILPPNASSARIAIMVSAGIVQPELRDDCPRAISELIQCCLRFEPESRPALSVVREALDKLAINHDAAVSDAKQTCLTRSATRGIVVPAESTRQAQHLKQTTQTDARGVWGKTLSAYNWALWALVTVLLFAEVLGIFVSTVTTSTILVFGKKPAEGLHNIDGQNDDPFTDRSIACIRQGRLFHQVPLSVALASTSTVTISTNATADNFIHGYRVVERKEMAMEAAIEAFYTKTCGLLALTLDQILSACTALGYNVVDDSLRIVPGIESNTMKLLPESLPLLIVPFWDN